MHDDTDEEDLEIWTVNGMSPFRHQEVHKVGFPLDSEGRHAIDRPDLQILFVRVVMHIVDDTLCIIIIIVVVVVG
jgi:hypothetical protein